MGYKVAVVGATGNVGREMLNILDERKFPADEVVALASRRSVGVEGPSAKFVRACEAIVASYGVDLTGARATEEAPLPAEHSLSVA